MSYTIYEHKNTVKQQPDVMGYYGVVRALGSIPYPGERPPIYVVMDGVRHLLTDDVQDYDETMQLMQSQKRQQVVLWVDTEKDPKFFVNIHDHFQQAIAAHYGRTHRWKDVVM